MNAPSSDSPEKTPERDQDLPSNASIDRDTSLSGPTALVAISKDGVIGDKGDLPWRLSSDLRRFKKITMGGVLIMGRKTYDSIGRPLPGRTTIVLTRDPNWRCDGVITASSPEEAIKIAANRESFVVGGAEIYRLLLPLCDRVFVTQVLASIDGDTRLKLDLSDFQVERQSRHPSSEVDEYETEFVEYHREKRS